MKRGKILRTITEKAGLHSEALPGVPLVELNGDDRVLVENHKCVVGYKDREILVRVCYGLLRFSGNGLVLACAKKGQLIIHGKIDSITLHRGE